MEWLFDPAIWIGLLTLVVLEVVLGIDNLVFIAILADKLPAKQRNHALLHQILLFQAEVTVPLSIVKNHRGIADNQFSRCRIFTVLAALQKRFV